MIERCRVITNNETVSHGAVRDSEVRCFSLSISEKSIVGSGNCGHVSYIYFPN